MTPEEELPVEGSSEPDPPPPPPAAITSAQFDYDGQTVMLKIIKEGETEETPYALNQTDPYGLSPWLRGELTRLVDAGEIEILPAPQMPEDE